MTRVQIGTLRYDIVSDTTSFVRGMRATRAQLKQADALFRNHRTPLRQVQHEIARLTELRKKDMISARIYRLEMNRLSATEERLSAQRRRDLTLRQRQRVATRRYGQAIGNLVAWWDRENTAIGRVKRSLLGVAAARKASVGGGGNAAANFGGSLGSALGFGGAGAGIGRLGGYGGGMAAVGLGAVGIKKSISEFAQLETAMVDLQVIMGNDKAGMKLVDNLRTIARETPLTTKQLVRNAQTMIGYGQSAEGIEDRLYRLGEISGGNTEKFNALTIAFSQVNSAGKLMGQELLQLVNAGYPIASIAEAAGVSMADFRKEMEAGNISARHLTESMISLTSEGGLMHGRLSRQAETVAGTWTRITGEMEQDYAEFGEQIQSISYASMGALKGLNDMLLAVGKGFDDIGTSIFGESSKGVSKESWYDRALGGVIGWIQSSDDLEQDLLGRYSSTSDYYGGSAGRKEYEGNQADWARKEASWNRRLKEKKIKEAEEKSRKDSIELEVGRYKTAEQSKLDAYKDRLNQERSLAYRQNQEWRALEKDSADWTIDQYNRAKKVMFERHKLEREQEKKEADAEKTRQREQELEKERQSARAMYAEFNRMEEEAKKANQKAADEKISAIDKDEKEQLSRYSEANKAAVSFDAGSVEEYNMRRDMALQQRKEARQAQIAATADADRKAMIVELRRLNDKAAREADTNRQAVTDTLKVLN